MSSFNDLDPDMLSQLLDDTRNDPDYLGNPNFSSEAHTAVYQSGPKVSFVRTTATGDEANVPLTAVAIVKVQDHNGWYHPEGTWGRPGMAQQFSIDVVRSQIRMLIGPAEPSDGPAFDILITDKDNEHLLANVKKLQERAFDVFKKSMKKPEMRLPLSKVGDYLVVSHKIFAERLPTDDQEDSDQSVTDSDCDSDSATQSTSSAVTTYRSKEDKRKQRKSTDEFSFDGYPACKAWKKEAEPLKQTHKIMCLPACDESGMPIKPSDYRQILPGSLVKISLNFNAYAIGTRVFALTAEIQGLQILKRGRPHIKSEHKRKFQDLVSEMKAAKKIKA